MRKISALLVVTLLGLIVAAPAQAAIAPTETTMATALAAGAQPKIVIIVGATEGTTSSYRSHADSEYDEAIKYTPNVVKVYSPNATWAAVQAAVDGASIVIYHGHGNGWPSPYPYEPTYRTKDGFGLNATAGAGDYNNTYYGEPYVSTLHFAPNAIVLLHNLCYASGNSEPGNPDPTLDVAKQRVDNYAAGFLAAGAKAVIADGHSSAVGYLRRLFTVDETLISTWRNQGNYHGNEFSFGSSRTPGATVAMDPDSPSGGYYRSIAGSFETRSTAVTGLAQTGYSPICNATNVRTQASTSSTSKAQLATTATVGVAAIVQGGSWTTNCVQDCPTVRSGSSWYAVTTVNGTPVSTLYGVDVVYAPTGALQPTPGPALPVAVPATSAASPPSTYVAVTPNRLLDSRIGNGFAGPLSVGVARAFQVTGRNPSKAALNIPSTAIAVTGNLTVTDATAGGWLSLTPVLDNHPPTSILNFPRGDSRANGVTVPLGTGGKLSVAFNGAAGGSTAHVIFDVTGYFVPTSTGATYAAVTPNRLLDSRIGNGFSGKLSVGKARAFQVTDRASSNPTKNVPATAIAVTGNLTATGATAGGWLSLTPSLDNHPATSTLNFPAGDDRANNVTVPLGSGGTLSVAYNGAPGGSTTDVVFDVTGYFLPGTSGAVYVAITPNRLLDSRFGNGYWGPLPVAAACAVQVTNRHSSVAGLNVPANAVAVTGNLTVTGQTAGGWLTATPALDNKPSTSTLNFPRGDTRANGLTVPVGAGGIVSIAFNGASSGSGAQAVFDVSGYFVPGS